MEEKRDGGESSLFHFWKGKDYVVIYLSQSQQSAFTDGASCMRVLCRASVTFQNRCPGNASPTRLDSNLQDQPSRSLSLPSLQRPSPSVATFLESALSIPASTSDKTTRVVPKYFTRGKGWNVELQFGSLGFTGESLPWLFGHGVQHASIVSLDRRVETRRRRWGRVRPFEGRRSVVPGSEGGEWREESAQVLPPRHLEKALMIGWRIGTPSSTE